MTADLLVFVQVVQDCVLCLVLLEDGRIGLKEDTNQIFWRYYALGLNLALESWAHHSALTCEA